MRHAILNDRVLVSEVERQSPELVDRLRRLGAIPAGARTVQFSGLIQDEFGNTTVFLPLKAGLNCPEDQRFEKARCLMRVLAKFGSRNERAGTALEIDGSVSLAHTIMELLKDYKRWGIFRDSVTRNSRNVGKADWKATSNRVAPNFQADGIPHFDEIRTRLLDTDTENPLSIIHAAVIREVQKNHIWWIPPSNTVDKSIRRLDLLGQRKEALVKRLKSLSKDMFASRDLALVRLLCAYLTQTGSERDGALTIGVRDFHTVWEVMLRETTKGVEQGWNRRLPLPTYIARSGANVVASGMLPDIVVRRNSTFVIVDAKYYAAEGAFSVPALGDALKQVCYRMAMSHIVVGSRVDTCFLFPSASGTEGRFEYLKFIARETSSEATDFGEIRCLYVDIDRVMEAYSSNRKIDPLSKWNSKSEEGGTLILN
ncbi:LlaJI family restriction endonuclease [Lysobacter soyae]|uniref:LlaJI family restriction endonuclease n=1 Tax=Lysobacter soyae TaxID=2764185 RepID=A0ABX8WSL4_9GAMM|nr:LlaJI family restriction endonuclease [Lysobacter sp. CJ11]QYR53813.1 LlaJI family restriction endonuclease [Lysobacter sp. CJ11]